MNKRASPAELASPQSLTDRAYAEIEELIVTLRLAPGAPVSEAELSGRLGIGRTPIREALQRLARERLVEIYPRRVSSRRSWPATLMSVTKMPRRG